MHIGERHGTNIFIKLTQQIIVAGHIPQRFNAYKRPAKLSSPAVESSSSTNSLGCRVAVYGFHIVVLSSTDERKHARRHPHGPAMWHGFNGYQASSEKFGMMFCIKHTNSDPELVIAVSKWSHASHRQIGKRPHS